VPASGTRSCHASVNLYMAASERPSASPGLIQPRSGSTRPPPRWSGHRLAVSSDRHRLRLRHRRRDRAGCLPAPGHRSPSRWRRRDGEEVAADIRASKR